MAKSTIFENKSLMLSTDEHNILYVEYKTRATNEEYVENLKKQVELVRQKKNTKVLFDLRKMGVLSSENQKYTSDVYMPQITQAGLKYAAMIVPENIFGELSAKTVREQIKDKLPLTMSYFKESGEGITWLKSA